MNWPTAATFAAATAQQRPYVAIQGLIDAGLDKGPAVTLAAIAMREVSSWWLKPRAGTALANLYSPSCWPSYQIPGPEFGLDEFNRARIPLVWQFNPTLIEALTSVGAITQATQPWTMSSAFINDPEMLATLVEASFWDRAAETLVAVSLGPTQMWMAQTKVFQDRVSEIMAGPHGTYTRSQLTRGAGLVTNFPQTWERIWQLYTAATIPEVLDVVLEYLRAQVWPGNYPTDRTRAITFLRAWQTGSTPGVAEAYADGYFMQNLGNASAIYDGLKSGGMSQLASLEALRSVA